MDLPSGGLGTRRTVLQIVSVAVSRTSLQATVLLEQKKKLVASSSPRKAALVLVTVGRWVSVGKVGAVSSRPMPGEGWVQTFDLSA